MLAFYLIAVGSEIYRFLITGWTGSVCRLVMMVLFRLLPITVGSDFTILSHYLPIFAIHFLKVSDLLTLLVNQERFQKAICGLPSFPRSDRITQGFVAEALYKEMDSYFAPFQTELEIVCSCPRTSLVQVNACQN